MFEWMWTSHPRCGDQVLRGWHKKDCGSNIENVRDNLKMIPFILRKWNIKVFGMLRKNIEASKKKLECLHNAPSNKDFMSRIREEEDNLSRLLNREEIF